MNFIKKYHIAFLSFLIPLIVYSCFFLSKGVMTKYNFATSDSLAQFVPTYQYLHDVLHNEATFPYTQTKGLGGSMYGALFYGISSPINLLVYFFEDVQLFMFISTILKMSLAGLTMYLLLRKKVKDSYTNLIFSFGYSFSTYILLYYTNIMWLDSIWLAPLLVLSIDKLIHQKKDLSYIIILFSALLSNYYSGYFLVVFSVIYFFYELYISYNNKNFFKDNKKLIIHFFIITFLTGLLISFILIPVGLEALDYIRVEEKLSIINFKYLDLFTGTYIGFGDINNPINYFGIPYYCGTVIIPIIISFYTNKNNLKKVKIATTIVFTLFFIPVIFPYLNMLWHLFTYPNGFNYRYTFLLVMFMLLIAAKEFNNLNISKKHLRIYIIIYLIISASMSYANGNSMDYYMLYIDNNKIIITILLLIINYILLVKNKKKLALLLLIIDLTINLSFIYNTAVFVSLDDSQKLKSNISEGIKLYDDDYRMESIFNLTFIDSMYYKYKGSTSFFSSANINSLKSQYILRGKDDLANHYVYLKHDIISDTLLGLKIIYDDTLDNNYTYIKTVDFQGKKYFIQKNDLALKLGFIVSNEIKELNNNKYLEFNYLNKLLNSLNGDNEDYFIKLNIKKKENKYIIEKNKNQSQLYIISKKVPKSLNSRSVYKSNKYFSYYNDNDDNLTLEFENNEKIEAYALNYKKFKKLIEQVEQIDIVKNKGNYIKASIEVKQDNKVLITTIPYEKGWKIFVDGKKVPYFKVIDSFIAIDIDSGCHTIEYKYTQPGLIISIVISILSLITLITYKLKYK